MRFICNVNDIEYKKIKSKKVKSVVADNETIIDTQTKFETNIVSINNKEKVRLSIFDKKNIEEKSIFVPKYYFFDITLFNKENYLIVTKDNKIEIYITPLIQTLILNINNFITKDETLARQIKERINSSARLLIKKSIQSKCILINNKKYVRINAIIKKTNKENYYAILNKVLTKF